jgi:hypothetical protein
MIIVLCSDNDAPLSMMFLTCMMNGCDTLFKLIRSFHAQFFAAKTITLIIGYHAIADNGVLVEECNQFIR